MDLKVITVFGEKEISDLDLEAFARAILPDIQEFYSKEENRLAYEIWKKEQYSKSKNMGSKL